MSSRGASTRSGRRFDIDRKRARVELIERESVQPGFWEDQKRAQALSKEKSGLELQLAQYERERQRLDDAIALHELAEEANDAATTPTGGSKRKSACTGWCASRPSTPTRGGTPRSPASSSIPRSTKTSTSISIPTTCASTPSGPPARAARKSTRPTRPSA